MPSILFSITILFSPSPDTLYILYLYILYTLLYTHTLPPYPLPSLLPRLTEQPLTSPVKTPTAQAPKPPALTLSSRTQATTPLFHTPDLEPSSPQALKLQRKGWRGGCGVEGKAFLNASMIKARGEKDGDAGETEQQNKGQGKKGEKRITHETKRKGAGEKPFSGKIYQTQ